MQNAKSRILDTTYIALFAALIAVCAFITIPMPLPFISFTLQTFGVFAALGILGGCVLAVHTFERFVTAALERYMEVVAHFVYLCDFAYKFLG